MEMTTYDEVDFEMVIQEVTNCTMGIVDKMLPGNFVCEWETWVGINKVGIGLYTAGFGLVACKKCSAGGGLTPEQRGER